VTDPIVRVEGLSKRFGAVTAVDRVSLEVARGEFFALLGASGCGKTTLLRLLAGLETPDAGRLVIDGQDMTSVPAHLRPVNMMFQSYALFPHMDVADNVGYGLRREGTPRAEIAARVGEALALVRLDGLERRKPAQLSGGQRQRVAMGRALVREPAVFLMDEPLSNLDANLRVQMRSEVLRVQRRLGVATLYVTHDQTEAMTMGDRVAVLRNGMLQQLAAPQDLYESPANLFVASFIGSPPMNLYEGAIAGSTDEPVLALGSQRLALPADLRERRPEIPLHVRQRHVHDADVDHFENGAERHREGDRPLDPPLGRRAPGERRIELHGGEAHLR